MGLGRECWIMQELECGWALRAVPAAPNTSASPFSCPRPLGQTSGIWAPRQQRRVAPPERFCWSSLPWLCNTALCSTQARRLQSFPESLMEVLKDADGELVGLTLSVLSKVLLDSNVAIATPVALQLAEALRPFFDSVRLYPLSWC